MFYLYQISRLISESKCGFLPQKWQPHHFESLSQETTLIFTKALTKLEEPSFVLLDQKRCIFYSLQLKKDMSFGAAQTNI